MNGGSYATGELYVVRTQDEDGNTASQFTDKQGHTVLVSQLNGTVRHDTYYVYDDYGNLMCCHLQWMVIFLRPV